MTRKKYEVAGMMEWHPVFKVGRSRIQISFTGGHLCGGASNAAFFETSDPALQNIIENSSAFKNGCIRLGQEYKAAGAPIQPSPKESVRANPHVDTNTKRFVFEYDNIEDVYEFLQHKKGVPLERLSDKDSCYIEAERLGITLKKK